MHKPIKSTISDLEKSKLDVLLKNYELITAKIEKFVGNQFIYTQGALALAGGYIFFLVEGVGIIDNATGNKEDTKLYLQFLPFFILLILTGVLYQYQRTMGLQGYKQYLERAINNLIGQNIVSYGHIGMKYMGPSNLVAALNTILYAIVYGASCYLAFVKPKDASKPFWWVWHLIAFILFMAFAIWQTWDRPGKVSRLAQEIFEKEESL